MQHFEARISPPDQDYDYTPPSHERNSDIDEGDVHFGQVLRALAMHYTDTERGTVPPLSYEKEQELVEAVYAGRDENADPATKQAAEKARQMLIESNARFARYYARASVGLQPHGKRLRRKGAKGDFVTEYEELEGGTENTEDMPAEMTPKSKQPAKSRPRTQRQGKLRYSPKDKTLGTYSNIARLASKHAELADRNQIALEGLVKAVDNCLPTRVRQEKTDKELAPSKFITYAAWSVQQAIDYGLASRESMETLAPRVPMHRQTAYYANRKLFGVDDLREVTPEVYAEKKGTLTDYDDMRDLQTWMEREPPVSFEEIAFPNAAPEEKSEYEGEEPEPLSLAEMIPADELSYEDLNSDFLKDEIAAALARLPSVAVRGSRSRFARLAGVLRLRFGISDEQPGSVDDISARYGIGTDRMKQLDKEMIANITDGQAKTLGEIAAIYGLAQQRIKDLETQALKSLRSTKHKELLEGTMAVTENIPVLSGAHRYAGDGLRTERTLARRKKDESPRDEHTERPRDPRLSLETWATLNEVRNLPETDLLQWQRGRIETALTKVIYELIWQPEINRRHYGKPLPEQPLSSYPDCCDIINEYIGNRLRVEDIAHLWNSYLPWLFQDEATPAVLKQAGQTVSYLLSTRMQPEDCVTLKIPEKYATGCDYLGAWLRQGHVIINGNAGDFVGMHMGGEAHITVNGDAMHSAGYGASGNARLEILGSVGHKAGQNIRDNAVISIASGSVKGDMGRGRRDNAQIIIDGEPLASSMPKVVRMSSRSAARYQSAAPTRPLVGAKSRSQALDKAPETGAQGADGSSPAIVPLDLLDLMSLEAPVPLLDPATVLPEEKSPIYDDFSTIPIVPAKPAARPKATPTPATPPPEVVEPETAAQDNEEDEVFLDFELASAYFGVSPEAFEKFASQVGYTAQDTLRSDDIVALQTLFPVLRLAAVPETGFISVAEAAQRLGFRGTAAQFAKDLSDLDVEVRRFRTYDGKAAKYIAEDSLLHE